MVWLGTLALAAQSAGAQTIDFSGGRWIDLTHTFDEHTLYWPTANTFHMETVFEGVTEAGFYYAAYDFATAEHGGTHLDAPVHFAAGHPGADQVPLERLIGPAVVVAVRGAAAEDPDYLVSVADLEAWIEANGAFPEHAIVLFDTGFAARWPDAAHYLGTSERGAAAVPLLHFPGISPEAARWLVDRRVAAVGIDTASVDRGQSTDFLTHRILYEADIPGFENVADLGALPAIGAFVVALPMKIRGGSGAPLRIAAFLPRSP
jgi:kynurenine formamidase